MAHSWMGEFYSGKGSSYMAQAIEHYRSAHSGNIFLDGEFYSSKGSSCMAQAIIEHRRAAHSRTCPLLYSRSVGTEDPAVGFSVRNSHLLG
jgi:hypothetical protein